MKRLLRFCSVVSLAVFAARSARGEEPYQPPDFIVERPALPEGRDLTTARRMTLRDALEVALEQNLSIRLQRQQLAQTREGTPVAKSRFEPLLTGNAVHTDADTVPSTAQEGQAGQVLKSRTDTWALGLAERVPTGTLLSLDFTNTRSRSSLGTAIQPDLFRSGLMLTITQPLLKGFAFSLDVPYADVLRAEFATERARQDVLGRFVQTVRDTELAYWDLVLALKSYRVQKSSLELGREQLVLTRRQIDAGVLPPSDLINAEGTVAQRELGLVQADADIETAADQLRRILNLPRETWREALLPLDGPRFDDRAMTFDDAMRRALDNRPEWKQRKLDVDKAKLDTRVAGTERLPQLDASFSYGYVGQDTSFSGGLSQLGSGNAPAWSARINLTWTPLNIGARGQLRAKEAAEAAAQTSMDQQLLDLHTEIRLALRQLDTAARSVRAAANFRVLAERSLDAEQRKFMNGTSSNFFIAQRQNDVVQAQIAEVQAVIRHQKAMTTLQAAMGSLLEENRVRLDVRAP